MKAKIKHDGEKKERGHFKLAQGGRLHWFFQFDTIKPVRNDKKANCRYPAFQPATKLNNQTY